MKQLKWLKGESNYGFHETKERIAINLSGLWQMADSELQFIDYYSRILHHEWLHKAIYDTLLGHDEDKEEEIVHALSGTNKLSNTKFRELYQVWNFD